MSPRSRGTLLILHRDYLDGATARRSDRPTTTGRAPTRCDEARATRPATGLRACRRGPGGYRGGADSRASETPNATRSAAPASTETGRPSRRDRRRRTSGRSRWRRRRPRPSIDIRARPVAASDPSRRRRARSSTARRRATRRASDPRAPASGDALRRPVSAETSSVAVVTASRASIARRCWASCWSTRDPTMSEVVTTERTTAAAMVATTRQRGQDGPSRRLDAAAAVVAAGVAAAIGQPRTAMPAEAGASGRGRLGPDGGQRPRPRSAGGISRTPSRMSGDDAAQPHELVGAGGATGQVAGHRLRERRVARHEPIEPPGSSAASSSCSRVSS